MRLFAAAMSGSAANIRNALDAMEQAHVPVGDDIVAVLMKSGLQKPGCELLQVALELCGDLGAAHRSEVLEAILGPLSQGSHGVSDARDKLQAVLEQPAATHVSDSQLLQVLAGCCLFPDSNVDALLAAAHRRGVTACSMCFADLGSVWSAVQQCTASDSAAAYLSHHVAEALGIPAQLLPPLAKGRLPATPTSCADWYPLKAVLAWVASSYAEGKSPRFAKSEGSVHAKPRLVQLATAAEHWLQACRRAYKWASTSRQPTPAGVRRHDRRTAVLFRQVSLRT